MLRTFDEARKLGYRAIVMFVHPCYFRGWNSGVPRSLHIATADGSSFDAFMKAAACMKERLTRYGDVFHRPGL